MLIGGSVKNDVGTMLDDQLFHPAAVRDIRHAADQVHHVDSLPEFLLQKELAVLIPVDQHQFPWLELQQLSADLRPMLPADPVTHEHLAVDPLVQATHIQFHRIPAQQIGDRDSAGLQVDSAIQQSVRSSEGL